MNLYYITQRDYDAHPLPFYWFSISSEKLAWIGQDNRPQNSGLPNGKQDVMQCTALYRMGHIFPFPVPASIEFS